MASVVPRGLIGRIYVGDHQTLLHTEYISRRPHGFREEDFFSFSRYKSMGANDAPGRGQFGPQGLDWQHVCRGPLNIATYSICKLWASWLQRRRCFRFLPLKVYGS